MKIVNSKNNHQSNPRIRFKAVAADRNLITIASRSRSRARVNNFRDSHNYNAQEEDNDEFEDAYDVETLIGKNLGKIHRLPSQNYQNLQHSGVRPRKFSKSGSISSHSYWNENGGDHVYKEEVKRENDSIGEIVSSIRVLADGFVRMEKMKMDVVHEIEKMQMEAEMKRDELLLESQKQIVQAFLKAIFEQQQTMDLMRQEMGEKMPPRRNAKGGATRCGGRRRECIPTPEASVNHDNNNNNDNNNYNDNKNNETRNIEARIAELPAQQIAIIAPVKAEQIRAEYQDK
ncbi:hypothetical protein L1987_17606 [Smallanthus sonchifolius]|uniref:Uncharacterized protein n=1 Tax=Smallanthus sonchifolius TaxID=185202 RepID=A0ACB9IYX6_9ASTR|nr:hypothetical protein L1987_17606 [Smallanthus sonchifolius]